jgi:hypothetical protein
VDVLQVILVSILVPVVVTVAGSVAVSIVIKKVDERRADRRRREEFATDIMRLAFGFYTPLEELRRRKKHKQEFHPEDLAEKFEYFRVAARVLEEQLDFYFLKDKTARWLWHEVIDLLVIRYYDIVQVKDRLDVLIDRHGQHPTPEEEHAIPNEIKPYFLSAQDLHDMEETLDRFNRVLPIAIERVFKSHRRRVFDAKIIRAQRLAILEEAAAAKAKRKARAKAAVAPAQQVDRSCIL